MLPDLLLVKGNISVLGLVSVQVENLTWKVENLVQGLAVLGPWVVVGGLQIDLGWVVMRKVGVG